MDPAQPDSLYLRSTSAVSLHKRFSQVLVTPLSRSCPVTSDPASLQTRRVLKPTRSTQRLLLLPQNRLSCGRMKQRLKKRRRKRMRRSVWTRLGWYRVSTWNPPGFWSFRKKYRWRSRTAPSWRSGRKLRHTLRWGGATAFKGRGYKQEYVPTRKQLDAELDDYMSMTRSRLDQDLDDYMSMSQRNLDAQLDDYMLMAGQSNQD